MVAAPKKQKRAIISEDYSVFRVFGVGKGGQRAAKVTATQHYKTQRFPALGHFWRHFPGDFSNFENSTVNIVFFGMLSQKKGELCRLFNDVPDTSRSTPLARCIG